MQEIAYIKLSDLTRRIRQVINETFGEETFWIIAEISGHKFYPDRDRHYFDLVEKIDSSSTETAKVKANSWEQGSRQIKLFEDVTGQTFSDGLQVLVSVKVNYHIVYGLSMTVVDIDPNFTLGNVERQRRETLRRLLDENADCVQLVGDEYITRNKQLKLNCVIQRIALIGSPKSEGYTDFVHTLSANQYGYKFTIDFYYSTVQGVTAEQELYNTFIEIYHKSKIVSYDCVVVTRGGGARTDFLVFDTYSLAKVAARFPIPIITGIGHHKDVSVVDMMVNTQTKTPTKAAEFILAHNRGFEESILRFQQRVIIRTQQLLSTHNSRINHLHKTLVQVVPGMIAAQRNNIAHLRQNIQHRQVKFISDMRHQLLKSQQAVINCSSEILRKHDRALSSVMHKVVSKPKELVFHQRNSIAGVVQLLKAFSSRLIMRQSDSLVHQRAMMNLMSPENILRKGFAIVSKGSRIVTKQEEINQGDDITITLDKTDIQTTVNSKSPQHGKFDV